jgi:SagB-type dehydrogenase family enzyme
MLDTRILMILHSDFMMGGFSMRYIIPAAILLLVLAVVVMAQELKPVKLPAPMTTGGKPLMQALNERHSTREFSADTIAAPVLSSLLWASCGINRVDEGKRTAPSAMNKQEIDIYVANATGVFLYNPAKNILQPIAAGDFREKTGMQDFVKSVPVNLIYVADFSKMSGASDTEKIPYAYADAAFCTENVYLFCASEGLGVVVRGSVNRSELEKTLKLRPEQHVILAQSVGYPKK